MLEMKMFTQHLGPLVLIIMSHSKYIRPVTTHIDQRSTSTVALTISFILFGDDKLFVFPLQTHCVTPFDA